MNIAANENGLLKGKRVLIAGVANEFSIAWPIALECYAHGASIVMSVPDDSIFKRVNILAPKVNCEKIIRWNANDPTTIEGAFNELDEYWPEGFDAVVHAIAFSDKNQLRGHFIDTTRENFMQTMNISCFSFIELCKYSSTRFRDGGSILTLTYYGSEKVIQNYNVMGPTKAALESSVRYAAYDLGEKNIRVNAISSGPIRTLAASGIAGIQDMISATAKFSPLRRSTKTEDVAGTAMYLLSNMSDGVTGQVIYVDSGYSTIGMYGV